MNGHRPWASQAAYLLLGFLLCIPLHVEAKDKRVALVIGNSNYEHVANLRNPANDAADLAGALKRIGFEVTSGQDLDYTQMRLKLRDFALTARDADMVMIYFAGHGIEIDNTNYVIPVNARLNSDLDVEFEAIRLDAVVNSVASSPGLKVVLVDACRNNPFVSDMVFTKATRSVGRGLGRIDSGGVMVGYAARGGTLALDGDGRNSPYAQALLTHIEKPGLEIGKMFRKVRDTVFDLTDGYQEPFTYGSLPGEDIFLVPKPIPAALPAPTSDPVVSMNAELATRFAAADRLNTLTAWDQFLTDFGAHQTNPLLKLAAQKRQELADQGTDVDEAASRLQEELRLFAAAEKLATPRGWALYFERVPFGRLKSSATVREENALLSDVRARVYGRYRSVVHGETMTAEMRKAGLAMINLTDQQTRQMQLTLKHRGNNIGSIDGQIGPRTMQTLQAVQRANELLVTGLPTRATMAAISQFDVRFKPPDMFATSGAIARVIDDRAAALLERDARLDRVLSAFRGRMLIYGYFRERLYVAVFLGTTIGEPELEEISGKIKGRLVEIGSSEEQKFVLDLVRFDQKLWTAGQASIKREYGPTIGLTSAQGQWQWRSGREFSYENWAQGQPKSAGADVQYGRLVPVGAISRNAHQVQRAGWAIGEDPSHTLIFEIE